MKYEGTKQFRVTDGSRSTYELKAKIKKAGGRWDTMSKSWTVALYCSDSLWYYDDQLTFTEASKSKGPMKMVDLWGSKSGGDYAADTDNEGWDYA